jgi:hypothetical protein
VKPEKGTTIGLYIPEGAKRPSGKNALGIIKHVFEIGGPVLY